LSNPLDVWEDGLSRGGVRIQFAKTPHLRLPFGLKQRFETSKACDGWVFGVPRESNLVIAAFNSTDWVNTIRVSHSRDACMSQEPIPPMLILRSFLTVASGYALSIMSLMGIAMGLGYAFFPEFIQFLELDPETQKNIIADDPATAIPTLMFGSLVVLNALACFAIGWFVIKTAPFAHFYHAVFLAILMFISYLQIAIADPPAKKTLTLICMIVFPMAVLLGAKWAFSRNAENQDPDKTNP
jgi:hypothetical protein